MALSVNTYGAVAGLERLIGDIVAARTFGAGTVPTITQAEAELDNVASELNALLDAFGYTAPVVEADNPFAYGALKAANEYGAAARLLATIPSQSYDPDDQITEGGTTRGQMYERYLNQIKKQIAEHKIKAVMSTSRFGNMIAGGATDSDGNTRKPIFKRGDLDYPGISSASGVTESDS